MMERYLPSKHVRRNEAGSNAKLNRILVIEDSRILQSAIVRLLQEIRPETEVDWVTTADEVVEMIQDGETLLNLRNYELLIADLTLPGNLSGLDFWEICRRSHPGVPFLMISGIGTEQYLCLTSKLKAPPLFLAKPFRLYDFRTAIESLVRAPALKAA